MDTKILIVDDDANIRELLRVNLSAAGYRIRTADNGAEAMGMISREPPDLLILDIMMPEMDGWEVCKAVKDDPATEGIRTLILTAKGTDRDRMIGKAVFRADEYMAKPFDVDELLAVVARLLNA
jgi:DNA-binding response OmpR family regulator